MAFFGSGADRLRSSSRRFVRLGWVFAFSSVPRRGRHWVARGRIASRSVAKPHDVLSIDDPASLLFEASTGGSGLRHTKRFLHDLSSLQYQRSNCPQCSGGGSGLGSPGIRKSSAKTPPE